MEDNIQYLVDGELSVRNPKAQGNQVLTKGSTVRKLHFAGMLMYKIDSAMNQVGRR